jgi:hypothetical protein
VTPVIETKTDFCSSRFQKKSNAESAVRTNNFSTADKSDFSINSLFSEVSISVPKTDV